MIENSNGRQKVGSNCNESKRFSITKYCMKEGNIIGGKKHAAWYYIYTCLLKRFKKQISWEKKRIRKSCTGIAPSTVWAIEQFSTVKN